MTLKSIMKFMFYLFGISMTFLSLYMTWNVSMMMGGWIFIIKIVVVTLLIVLINFFMSRLGE